MPEILWVYCPNFITLKDNIENISDFTIDKNEGKYTLEAKDEYYSVWFPSVSERNSHYIHHVYKRKSVNLKKNQGAFWQNVGKINEIIENNETIKQRERKQQLQEAKEKEAKEAKEEENRIFEESIKHLSEPDQKIARKKRAKEQEQKEEAEKEEKKKPVDPSVLNDPLKQRQSALSPDSDSDSQKENDFWSGG
jgi:hypothetical protein